VWLKGSWRDTFYMGILEDEWTARKKMKGVGTTDPVIELDL
jgi:hypothetical protein